MALFQTQKREHQTNQRPGLIRSLFSLLKGVVPQTKSRSVSQTQEQPASAERPSASRNKPSNSKNSKKQAANANSRNRKQAQASVKRQSSKAAHKTKSKSAHVNGNRHRKQDAVQAENQERNPKDVIPDQPQDPAHSQGHRKIHIEKELH